MMNAQTLNGTAAYPAGMTQTRHVLAEAQCSVNLFFEVEGYGKAQATGRGKTPQEAAANLKATIDETRAAFAPPAPVVAPLSRAAQVAALMAKGIACAVAKQDLGLVERIGKAAALVLSNAIQPTNSPTALAVRSMAHPESWYDVTLAPHGCSCPDWQRHRRMEEGAYYCKHILGAIINTRLESAD